MLPKVYVILVNWNGEKDTIPCLDTLLTVNYDNMHVVISDNGSQTQSIKALKDWAQFNKLQMTSPDAASPIENTSLRIKTLCLIESKKNLGFTGANTAGINYALEHNAAYVLFLNNDTLVTENFLVQMIDVAESESTYGMLGCKTYFADKDAITGKHKIWSLGGYEYVYGNPMNIGSKQFDRLEWKGVRENDLICGCCMLIRRKVIETIGVQDDDLFFGIDDVEYSLRARENGWENVLVLDAVIYHSGSHSVEGRTGLQLYYLFRNTYYFRNKYFPWYQNVVFFTHHLFRYFLIGGVGRFVLGRGSANIGMISGIYDFLSGNMGECKHMRLLKKE